MAPSFTTFYQIECGWRFLQIIFHNGDWIIGFASNFNYASSNQVEFYALKRGLEMATRLGIGKLQISSNS